MVGEEKESNSDIRKKNRKSWDRAKNGKKEGGIDEQTTLKYSIYRQKNEKMNMEVKKKKWSDTQGTKKKQQQQQQIIQYTCKYQSKICVSYQAAQIFLQ